MLFSDNFRNYFSSLDCCNCLKFASVMSHNICCNYFFSTIRQFSPSLLVVISSMLISNCMLLYVTAFSKGWLRRKLGVFVCLECPYENRPFSGQQHQAQFGLNPALLQLFKVKGQRSRSRGQSSRSQRNATYTQ